MSSLGGDQDHSIGCARSVDRRRGRTLEDLDRFDIGRIDVRRTIRGRVSTLPVGERSAIDREERGGDGLVVDRLSVHYKQGLISTGKRRGSANQHGRARARLTRLRANHDIRSLSRERGDNVLRLRGATNQRAVDRIDRHSQFLAGRRRSGARHDDLAEAERIDRQAKGLIDRGARGQRYRNRARRVPDDAGGQGRRSPGGPACWNDERVAAVVARLRAEVHPGDEHCRAPEGHARIAGYAAGHGRSALGERRRCRQHASGDG